MENNLNETMYENVIVGNDWVTNYLENQENYEAREQEVFEAQQQTKEMLDNVTAVTTAISLGFMLIVFIASLISLVSTWKIYKKANKPGWASIVPIYNNIVMLDICGLPVWMIILALFVTPVYLILTGLNLAKKFNKGTGFAIGLIFLPIIFYPILAFGKSQYEGNTINDLPNNNNMSNEINNNINPINQNNNEVVNNQEVLSNELGFAPQMNNTNTSNVVLQPNMYNDLNQNVANVNNTNDFAQNQEPLQTINSDDSGEVNSVNVNNNTLNNNQFDIQTNMYNNDLNQNIVNTNVNNTNDFAQNQEPIQPISIVNPMEENLSNEVNNVLQNQQPIHPINIVNPVEESNMNVVNENINNNPNIGFSDLTSKIELNNTSVNSENICPNCGNKYNSGDMFCINCGSKLN